MIALAARSLRHRVTAFAATSAAVMLGTTIIGSFATLIGTATGDVGSDDRETLITMGAVIGAWGALIVLFSVVSMVGITVGNRAHEIGLLRTIGSTPRQARRLVRIETLAVCGAAAFAGAAVARFTGAGLLAAMRATDLVADDVEYGGAVAALAITVAGMIGVCTLAAAIAARRATSGPPSLAPAMLGKRSRMRWWRYPVAVLLIGHATSMAVLTMVIAADSDDPYEAMEMSGSSSIVAGVALAVLAPVLLRIGASAIRPLAARFGAEGYLAAFTTSRRAHLLSGVFGSVTVLTAASVGTLMLVGIDGRTMPAGADVDDTVNLLNYLVVAMMSLFAAIHVVNSFAALVANRRDELRQLWLIGADDRQLARSVTGEAGIVATIAVALGLVAAGATVVPFSVARDEGVIPDAQLWLPPLLAAGIIALTMGAAHTAVRRTVGRADASPRGQARLAA